VWVNRRSRTDGVPHSKLKKAKATTRKQKEPKEFPAPPPPQKWESSMRPRKYVDDDAPENDEVSEGEGEDEYDQYGEEDQSEEDYAPPVPQKQQTKKSGMTVLGGPGTKLPKKIDPSYTSPPLIAENEPESEGEEQAAEGSMEGGLSAAEDEEEEEGQAVPGATSAFADLAISRAPKSRSKSPATSSVKAPKATQAKAKVKATELPEKKVKEKSTKSTTEKKVKSSAAASKTEETAVTAGKKVKAKARV
jgi:hypothetical protein